VADGAVLLNGSTTAAGRRLVLGDRLTAAVDLNQETAARPEPIPISVVYEDQWLAVVEKPSGMVAHPAGRHLSGTLANALSYHFNTGVEPRSTGTIRPGMAHRLDRETSGLMVVAKCQAALSALTVQFQKRTVDKRYLALVFGTPLPVEGEWHAPIGCDWSAFPRWGIRDTGRPAASRYRVLTSGGGYSLLELEPMTGRTNQLRLHAAHFGHPIVGDGLFGRGPEVGLERLFLHARYLAFRHPNNGLPVAFQSVLPDELRGFLTVRGLDPGSP
jgi:23S rRNA pseudouridine1911/1915/1917 synthase